MGSFIYSKFALACFWVIEREGVWFGTKDSLGIERAACFEDPRVVGANREFPVMILNIMIILRSNLRECFQNLLGYISRCNPDISASMLPILTHTPVEVRRLGLVEHLLLHGGRETHPQTNRTRYEWFTLTPHFSNNSHEPITELSLQNDDITLGVVVCDLLRSGLVVKTVALPDEDHFQYCNACGLASGTLCSLHQETMGAQGTAGSGKFCARNVRGMGGQRSGSCFRCGEVGHFARGCPHSRNSRY